MERTLSIIKPDAVGRGLAGRILARLESEGFRVLGLKMLRMSKAQSEGFYHVHKARPFFASLTDYMSSGPAIVMVLEGEQAVQKLREVMGATDPAKADEGTVRKEFGTSIERNVIHGSDSLESAAFEISYFFSAIEIISF